MSVSHEPTPRELTCQTSSTNHRLVRYFAKGQPNFWDHVSRTHIVTVFECESRTIYMSVYVYIYTNVYVYLYECVYPYIHVTYTYTCYIL